MPERCSRSWRSAWRPTTPPSVHSYATRRAFSAAGSPSPSPCGSTHGAASYASPPPCSQASRSASSPAPRSSAIRRVRSTPSRSPSPPSSSAQRERCHVSPVPAGLAQNGQAEASPKFHASVAKSARSCFGECPHPAPPRFHAVVAKSARSRFGECPRFRASSGGALLGDLVQPFPDLLGALADVVQPRQLRQALEPEDALEERRRAVANRAAGRVVAPGLGDQPALGQIRDG